MMRVFTQGKICFQTPFPAKLQVFHEDGMRLYQRAEEATTDMKDKGLPVSVMTLKQSLAEQASPGNGGRTEAAGDGRGTREEHLGETTSFQETALTPSRRAVSSD